MTGNHEPLIRVVKRGERKVEARAVVRVDENVADLATRVPLLNQVAEREEITRRLGHLLAVDTEVRTVHPGLHELLARRRLGLRNLVLMMRKEIVDAARMQVERLAQILHGHRRTLDVPAGTPPAPRRIPSDRTVRRLPRLPQGKVPDVLLVVLVRRAAEPGLLVVKVDVRELAVARKLPDLEIDRTVFALVRDALLHQLRDERNHLGNVVRRRGIDLRRLDVELLKVSEERVLVRFRERGQRHTLRVRPANRLVVDVRQVHHLPDLHAVELDNASEDILERIGAEVADVREIVDRRSAGVKANRVVGERLEFLNPTRKRIENVHARIIS